jgi:hypothetical protein
MPGQGPYTIQEFKDRQGRRYYTVCLGHRLIVRLKNPNMLKPYLEANAAHLARVDQQGKKEE